MSKCDEIRSFLRIWSHLLNKSLMENFIFYAVILHDILTDISITYYSLLGFPYSFDSRIQYSFNPRFQSYEVDPRQDCRDLTELSQNFCSTSENSNLFKFRRTVSGICNNLTPGKGAVGAADTQVARLARTYKGSFIISLVSIL